ncbi:MAG TPA: cupin domain-containing protein [Candidatus Binataceae bacterium]|nr:cupin domain-containing protein [Candidatus Binataceae bacterium]
MVTTLDLSQSILGLYRDGHSDLVAWESGPPPRIDGYVIGTPKMTRPAPHAGEMHPDGDEVLFLIAGKIAVVLEKAGAEDVIEMNPGQTVVVPRGVWHRVLLREPSQLLHITPGPGGEWRSLREE